MIQNYFYLLQNALEFSDFPNCLLMYLVAFLEPQGSNKRLFQHLLGSVGLKKKLLEALKKLIAATWGFTKALSSSYTALRNHKNQSKRIFESMCAKF
jgi:hypothetical protein